MIAKGVQPCFNCMQESKRMFYCINKREGHVVVEAEKNVFGEIRMNVVNSTLGEVSDVSVYKVKKKHGIPVEIQILLTIKDVEKNSIYCLRNNQRICEHCYLDRGIISYLPMLPEATTYVIVVAGRPGVGKTALIDAINYKKKLAAQESVAHEATSINTAAINLRSYIPIRNKKKKLAANVVIIDTPGEIEVANHDSVNLTVLEAQQHMNAFIMADAMIYVADYHRDVRSDNLLAMLEVMRGLPIGVVVTKCDLLENGYYNCEGRGQGFQIVTDEYFRKKKKAILSKQEASIQAAVDEYVVKKLNPSLAEVFEDMPNVSYFVVSSGQPDQNKGNVLHRSRAYAILEPLHYLLAQLGAYEYPKKGGR